MTRGRWVIITKRGIYASIEFNGDMYYRGGHGEEVVKILKRIKGLADFKRELLKFNDKHFGYEDLNEINAWCRKADLDLREKTYFKNFNWFSDYLYFKNLTKEDVYITNFYGKKYVLHPNEIAIYNFGCKTNYKI